MGAQLRVYRQRIRSAQTTKKVTRAMELILASRIQKAQARMKASGPYSRAITRPVSAVATFSDVDHILTTDMLVKGEDCFFVATGITDGELLKGVHYRPNGATSHSLVMRSRSGTIRSISAEHQFEKLREFADIDYER